MSIALLVIGLLIFSAAHLLPRPLGWREQGVQRLGEMPYKGVLSLVIVLGFALIVYGKANAEFIAIFTPPSFAKHLAFSLVPFALILLVATYIPNNIRRFVKHPMLAATKLWALVHIIANGDLASLILFVGFLAYAVASLIQAKRFGLTSERQPVSIGYDLLVVVVGILATGLIMKYHAAIAGVALI